MRILIFILLKVLEISSIVFVPYWVGKFAPYKWAMNSKFDKWMTGLGMIILSFLGLCFLILFIHVIIRPLISVNWEWAGKILGQQ